MSNGLTELCQMRYAKFTHWDIEYVTTSGGKYLMVFMHSSVYVMPFNEDVLSREKQRSHLYLTVDLSLDNTKSIQSVLR